MTGLADRQDVAVGVVTPWYPLPHNAMGGSFVAEQARLATRLGCRVRVVHGQEWPGGTSASAPALREPFDAVLDRLREAGGLRLTGAVGPLDRVPVFTVGGADWGQRGLAMLRDVERGLGSAAALVEPVVHGHVGYLGGFVAARLADDGARVVVSEHSSALRDVLAQPAALEHYREVMARADVVTTPTAQLRDLLVGLVGDPRAVVRVLPNPVDVAGAPHRPAPPQALRRWAFVGTLAEHKGADRALAAFLTARRHDPELSLTFYGDGTLREELTTRAVQAGAGDRVHFRGVMPRAQVLAALPQHDLLVAPSRYETFHLAVVEAVAAGLPVIVTRSGGPQETLAGIEDQVGRFVDVGDDPEPLVEAWRDLGDHLDGLDLPAARAELERRFGVTATLQRLADAYALPVPTGGCSSPGRLPVTVAGEPAREGRQVVVLSVSGWRRYGVAAELDAARRLQPGSVTVVTGDANVTADAAGMTVLTPAQVSPTAVAQPLQQRSGGGGLAGRIAGLVRREAPPAASSAVVLPTGAALLIGDCQSMPLASRLLEARPDLVPLIELDRVAVLGPAVDQGSPSSAVEVAP